jgi:hypothetical protein
MIHFSPMLSMKKQSSSQKKLADVRKPHRKYKQAIARDGGPDCFALRMDICRLRYRRI